MKKCIYTCITGNYDCLKEFPFLEKEFDYICFTNNKKIKSNTWTIKFIEENLDNLTLARKVKILGYKYLKNYDLTIWVDGGMNVLKPISQFLNDKCNLKKYDMVGFNHQDRHCIYEEIKACVYLNKETPEKALEVEKFLEKEGYPHNNGLIESSILVRKNIKSINDLMDLWFATLESHSRRDQLSFNYCLWKKPIKIQMIDECAQHNEYFDNEFHDGYLLEKERIMKIYYGTFPDDWQNLDYHKMKTLKYNLKELKNGIKIKVLNDCEEITLNLDNQGDILESINIDDCYTYRPYNCFLFDGKNYFNNFSQIFIKGKFKRNQILEIFISITPVTEFKKIINFNLSQNENYILKQKINSLEELASKVKELEKASQMIATLEAEKVALKEELTLKNNELISVYQSRSWKLTQPLREITAIINNSKTKK